MKRDVFLSSILLVLVLSACLDDTALPEEEVISMELTSTELIEALMVPANFEFGTTQNISLDINVEDGISSVIEVYNDDPNNDGALISKGMTNAQNVFSTSLSLPTTASDIFVIRHSLDGSITKSVVQVGTSNVSYTFGNNQNKSAYIPDYLVEAATGYATCETKPDFEIEDNKDVEIEDNKVYRYAGAVEFNKDVEFKGEGGTLVVCSDMTISDLSFPEWKATGTIYVAKGATLTIEKDFKTGGINNQSFNIFNFGTIQLTDGENWKKIKETSGSRIENHGVLECKEMTSLVQCEILNMGTLITYDGDIELKQSSLSNLGIMTIEELEMEQQNCGVDNSGTITAEDITNKYGELINYQDGTITVTVDCKIYEAGTLTNHGIISADKEFEIKKPIINNGTLTTNGDFDLTEAGEITMGERALIYVGDKFTAEGEIYGPDETNDGLAYALIKMDGSQKNVDFNNGEVSGKVDICATNGYEQKNGFDFGSAVTFCEAGNITESDDDDDGVPDSFDEYPTNAAMAFNLFYPSETGHSCLAFEDLWPATGDYDFNDLVVNFRYQTVINADNKVVEIRGSFDIVAVGASSDNGLGFVLDIAPSAVASVSGMQILGGTVDLASNGVENGHQEETVIIVCDKINSYAQPYCNTIADTEVVDFEAIEIHIVFNSPQDAADIGSAPFNPFIFVDQDRGREIHLINQKPTALANTTLFGSLKDNTIPSQGKYYCTQNNFPFVMELPLGFSYPQEEVDIISAYSTFATWAESGGGQNKDWYQNGKSGKVMPNE